MSISDECLIFVEALTVFSLAAVAVTAAFVDLGVQVSLPIATGLIGYLQGRK